MASSSFGHGSKADVGGGGGGGGGGGVQERIKDRRGG